MKLSKIAVGWYANEDGTWAVIGDAPGEVATKLEADGGDLAHAAGINTGCSTQREWQVVRDPSGRLREDSQAGQVYAWVDTLREGREVLASEVVAPPSTQVCRDCGKTFPYDEAADYCPACVASQHSALVVPTDDYAQIAEALDRHVKVATTQDDREALQRAAAFMWERA